MNELDHMLKGSASQRHHQDIIRQAQQEKFARDIEAAQTKGRRISPLRALLTLVITLLLKR